MLCSLNRNFFHKINTKQVNCMECLTCAFDTKCSYLSHTGLHTCGLQYPVMYETGTAVLILCNSVMSFIIA